MSRNDLDPPQKPYRRKTCPGCRYPMLGLKGFDGTSSADAMGFESDDFIGSSGRWGADIFILGLLYSFFEKQFKSSNRKKKVEEFKRDILPQYPEAVICPQCLHVEW